MKTPILTTKFYIPALRAETVVRPRLLADLESARGRKLVLVSAPAGFGKTSLLSEWIRGQMARGEADLCWLTLERSEDAPRRFWWYFIHALQLVRPDLGAAALQILESSEVSSEQVLTVLINEMAESSRPLVMVLDDYHVIESQEIQAGMAFLVEHQPAQFHLAVATRVDPPWNLARLRAQEKLLELRQSDLRFTQDEAASFLNHSMALGLEFEAISALERRTEGWIAGLQMAAISMRGRDDLAGFIQSFTGSHRFVLDYLLEEVLDQQPLEVREFLLRTSILERLNGSLCDAVMAGNGGQSRLRALEQQNLFLIPLDEVRAWYRYHALFADLLRHQVAQKEGDLLPRLHQRASKWYGAHGYWTEAVQHALSSGDFELAAEQVEANVLGFKDAGELAMVKPWLDAFPEAVVNARPWLCVAKSWVSGYLGDPDTVRSLLERAEAALGQREPGPQRAHIEGHMAAIRAYLALFDGAFEASRAYGRRALELLPEGDIHTRISAATTLASVLRLGGDLAAADGVLREALRLSRQTRGSTVTVRLLCALSALQHTQGKIKQALESLEEAIEAAKIAGADGEVHFLPVAGQAYNRMANLLMVQYQLEAALEKVRRGIKLSEEWGQANALWEGYRIEAEILVACGDIQGAQGVMDRFVAVSRRIAAPWAARQTRADQALFYVTSGDIPAAVACIESFGLQMGDEIGYDDCEIYGIWAYLLLAQGKAAEALVLIEKIRSVVEKAGAVPTMVSILILGAVAYQQMGAESQAYRWLAQAVSLAEPAGIVKDFVEDGSTLQPALRQMASQGQATAFIGTLLGHMAGKDKEEAGIYGLAEGLSAREVEVLHLLNTSLDSRGIAEQLVISVNTARTHIRNIYAKLGVKRRMEAVERGRELGILD